MISTLLTINMVMQLELLCSPTTLLNMISTLLAISMVVQLEFLYIKLFALQISWTQSCYKSDLYLQHLEIKLSCSTIYFNVQLISSVNFGVLRQVGGGAK